MTAEKFGLSLLFLLVFDQKISSSLWSGLSDQIYLWYKIVENLMFYRNCNLIFHSAINKIKGCHPMIIPLKNLEFIYLCFSNTLCICLKLIKYISYLLNKQCHYYFNDDRMKSYILNF